MSWSFAGCRGQTTVRAGGVFRRVAGASCQVLLADSSVFCRRTISQRFFSQKPARQQDTKGISAKKADFAAWYTQVITRSEMVEYYDVSGCYILRPWSFHIWQHISRWLDSKIQELGAQNAYFPCFVSQEALQAEEEHLEGFAPEVAWVTKSGTSELTKPIAIRPTSETIMYPAFAKWIRSHRDLPLRLNQWTNVVRWEFKQPTPFLRTREFLWQEGHTAHASAEEATDLVRTALDLYSNVYTDLLALPVIKGVKSSEERFAGSVYTETLEAFIPATGRGIQAATAHYLGQNFAKMFGIRFEDDSGQKQYVHQTCWGFTTRCIGIMIMVHGDDQGLVLPPRIAPTQAVVIPIPGKDGAGVEARCAQLATALKECGVRAEVDARRYTPGWKFNWWEMKGVPIRLEVGPKDMAQGTCRMVRRLDGSKEDIDQAELSSYIPAELDRIHDAMLEKATRYRDEGIATAMSWDEVIPMLKQKKLILAPWCESAESEAEIRRRSKEELSAGEPTAAAAETSTVLTGAVKSLCIPLLQRPLPPGTKCFVTGEPAKRWGLFGHSY